jgi:hypothetical protein
MSERVHGYHERTLADVPVDARRVTVVVRVRRLACLTLPCARQSFREQLPGVLERYRRRTPRLAVSDLVHTFAELLRPVPDNAKRLDAWITAARAGDHPHLHAFTRGIDQDKDAVRAAVTLPFHNGGAEGVNTKTKRIMRQMHGRAGFELLRHRILLG